MGNMISPHVCFGRQMRYIITLLILLGSIIMFEKLTKIIEEERQVSKVVLSLNHKTTAKNTIVCTWNHWSKDDVVAFFLNYLEKTIRIPIRHQVCEIDHWTHHVILDDRLTTYVIHKTILSFRQVLEFTSRTNPFLHTNVIMGVVLFLYRTAVDFDIIETKVSEKSKTLYHIIELLQDRLHLLALYCEFNIGDIVSIPPSPLVLEKNFTYHDIVKSTETLVKDVYEEIRNHPVCWKNCLDR